MMWVSMNKSAVLLLVLVLVTSGIVAFLPVKAEPRTIVVPNDYSTITAAIDSAINGDTIFVRKGTYEGPINQTLVISKAISLRGEDIKSTRINLHPPWVSETIFTVTLSYYANPITIEADDVELSGFTITSDGGEIFATGNKTKIIGNVINTAGIGVSLHGCVGVSLHGSNQTITENTLITASITCSGTYGTVNKNSVVNGSINCDGSYNSVFANNVEMGSIGCGGTGGSNLVYGNIVKDGEGIWACVGNIVAKNTITNCSQGVNIGWGFNNIICGNIITNNREGLTKIEGLNNTFYANYVANNSVGVKIGIKSWQHTGNTTFYHNNFINNIQQTQIINLDHTDYWDNGKEGNYWSNYTGSDANRDGIGDTPYVIFGDSYHTDYPGNDYPDYTIYGDSYRDRYPLMAPFDISRATIELPDWAPPLLSATSSPSLLPSSSPTQEPMPLPNPFPTNVVVAASASAAIVVLGLLVCLKKRKHKA
jgi:nitrous oxidase accessory protein NosD